LSKYYTKFTEDEMRKIESEVHRTVTLREGMNAAEMCNFVEVNMCSCQCNALVC
jgi:hypothetical protein